MSELWERARRAMPGGVSSPVRAFRAVGGEPPVVVSAAGAEIRDAEGRSYVDLVGSLGPLILGHAQPAVVAAGGEIRDAEGRSYVGLVGSWGPLILGHAHPGVVEAVARAARDGLSFGA